MLDDCIARLPIVNRFYLARAASLKRTTCLLLHRLGLLTPFTFVEWLVTYACNFHCPYCEASAHRARPDELTTAEGQALIDDLRRARVRRLLLSGGEPLVRPDVIELMAYAQERGLRLGLVTNGYRVEELWPELQRFRLFLYFTSLDGAPEYNDRVRGAAGAFAHAMRGLERVAGRGVPVRMVNTVVHAENIDQLPQLLGLIEDSPATHWRLSPVARVGRAAQQDSYQLDRRQLESLVELVRAHRGALHVDLGESHTYLGLFCGGPPGKPFFCGAGLTRSSIMPTGDVVGCQLVYDSSLAEGNVRHKPFSRLWKEEFARFRQPGRRAACRGCRYFAACQGGCWAEMERQGACLKGLWERGEGC